MSEDPEIAKIMQRKMDEMLKPRNEPKIGPEIIDLNESNFDQIVSAENPTLVDFWAEWCGPCKAIAPLLDEIADEYADRMTVVKLDADKNPSTMMKFSVRSLPTLMLFNDGNVQAQRLGALSKSQLTEFLESNL